MSLLQRISKALIRQSYQLPVPYNYSNPISIGNEITLYPSDTGERYIDKGYKGNDSVYSIVSTNAEKAGQVRLYHSKVKRDERKTLREFNLLQKGPVNDYVIKELGKMQKAMIDENIVDSPLTKLLNRPTRNHTQAEWIELLVLLRELTGEGNIWKNRGLLDSKVPLELPVIPKPHLNIRGSISDPWEIVSYEFVLNGQAYGWKKEDVIMWKYTNPGPISSTFEHLRGLAPLQAAIVLLQGMNEGDLRMATSNKNAGANGFAFRKDALQNPTVEQKAEMRSQFNNAINSQEMTNKIAILAGEWGYHNLGRSIDEQKILEQHGYGFKRFCRVFHTPAGIFDEGNATWDNQKQFYRRWIFAKIAPMVYQLRSILNESLLPDFGLDPETNLINCDIMSLPELSQDLKEQVDAVKAADWLTLDEKRIATGYEPLGTPEAKKIYVSGNLQTLDQLNADIGKPLDDEENLLDL